MPIVDTYKSEFKIVAYDEDINRNERMNDSLTKRGFQFEAFSSRGLFLESLKSDDLAHLYLVYYQPLSMKFRETVDAIRKASTEVDIIVMGAKDFWPGVHNLLTNGTIDDFWTYPMAGKEELELRLNHMIEKRIYKLVAEQRSEATAQIIERLDAMKAEETPDPEFQAVNPAAMQPDVMSLINPNLRTESKIVTEFIDGLKSNYPNSEFIYFKNYKAKDQLLVTRTSFASENYFRGQAVAFSEERLGLDRDEALNSLRNLIGEQFAVEEFAMQPIEFAGEFFGLIMAVHFEAQSFLKKSARYLALTLRNTSLENHDRGVEIDNDLEVGVKKTQFPLVLSKEISRARRLKLPVSLVVGRIEYIGDQQQEFALAFEKIKSNLRSYDFVSHIDENKIAIILPHCGYEDAAIKAETIRRQLVARGLKTQNTPLRLCFGVSEYPALSVDSDALMVDAEKACQQVMVSGKNKVCLFTAEENHDPEFQPRSL